jgi:S-adenosylmethionine uptake transporter
VNPLRRAAPFLAAVLGIALFTLMDAVMKGLSLEIGPYRAMLWRTAIAILPALAVLAWVEGVRWPDRSLRLLHLQRGMVNALSAVGYFFGLTRLPMAEGIALAFIAPLVALYLAAALLGERVGVRAILGSLLGLGGVGLLLAARLGRPAGDGAVLGAAVILAAAVLYGYGLVLLRRQAQRATPLEVGFWQTGATLLWLAPAAPWLAPLPPVRFWPGLAAAALLAQGSIMLLAWAYRHTEAKRLIPIEYSGFLWAVLFGALFFGEALAPSTLVGAAVIVAGCALAASARGEPRPAEMGQ